MDRLLDIATDVFLEQGYEGTNVTEITRRAGASKTTFYSRYPTKADLFVAVMTRKSSKLRETFAETLSFKEPLGKTLEDFGIRYLRITSHPETQALYKVFAAASLKFPQLGNQLWDSGPKQSVILLRDYLVKHPAFKGAQPEYAAETFCALCCGLSLLKAQIRKDGRMSGKVILFRVKEAVRIFLSAYSSPSPVR